MRISTTRFGPIDALEGDVLEFAGGLIGMEECRRWVLLADAHNPALGWLQSVDRGDLALAVVSPRRFVPGYRVRVRSRDVAPLGLDRGDQAQVLVVLSRSAEGLAVNLKAPLVISLDRRCGRQVIAKDDHPVSHTLDGRVTTRRSA